MIARARARYHLVSAPRLTPTSGRELTYRVRAIAKIKRDKNNFALCFRKSRARNCRVSRARAFLEEVAARKPRRSNNLFSRLIAISATRHLAVFFFFLVAGTAASCPSIVRAIKKNNVNYDQFLRTNRQIAQHCGLPRGQFYININ